MICWTILHRFPLPIGDDYPNAEGMVVRGPKGEVGLVTGMQRIDKDATFLLQEGLDPYDPETGRGCVFLGGEAIKFLQGEISDKRRELDDLYGALDKFRAFSNE